MSLVRFFCFGLLFVFWIAGYAPQVQHLRRLHPPPPHRPRGAVAVGRRRRPRVVVGLRAGL